MENQLSKAVARNRADGAFALASVRQAADRYVASLSRRGLAELSSSCPELAESARNACLQAWEPFRVDVSGEVKVGKSSFVNAFLGQDLAPVAVEECTAVRSEFHFGRPPHPDRPIHVFFRDGSAEWRSPAFINELTGSGEKALELAARIAKLDFEVDAEALLYMVLADTPGLNSVVKEHEASALESLGEDTDAALKRDLRQRNDFETRMSAASADAVLWLAGNTALEQARAHLAAFLDASGLDGGHAVRASNVMVVLTKTDVTCHSKGDIAKLLSDAERQLNSRLPCRVRIFAVSSGIERLLQKIGEPILGRWRDILVRLRDKSAENPARLLKSERKFPEELKAAGLTPAMLDIPKGVFVRCSEILLESGSLNEAVATLESLSGFKALREAVSEHFAKHSAMLKSRVVVAKCLTALHKMAQEGIERTRQRIQSRRKEIAAFTRYVISHPDYRSPTSAEYASFPTGEALREFLDKVTPRDAGKEACRELEKLRCSFRQLSDHLRGAWTRLEGLSAMEEAANFLSLEEKKELIRLFGTAPYDNAPPGDFQQRARYWGGRVSRNPALKSVALMAETVYLEWCPEMVQP